MLEFSWPSFGFAVVNFIVLAAVLWRFLHKPLLNALDKREDEIAAARTKAREETDAAAAMRRKYEAKVAEAGAERDQLLADARRTTEAAREATLKQATEEARREADRVTEAAARERTDAVNQLGETVTKTAVSLAGKILSKLGDDDIEARLHAQLLDGLQKLDPAACTERDDVPVLVSSARELPEAAKQDIADAVEKALSRQPEFTYEVDPALVAGTRVAFHASALDATLADILSRATESLRDSQAPPAEEGEEEDKAE